MPGGSIEDGEDEKEAVVREVKEETNLDIQLGKKVFEFIDIENENRKEIYYIANAFDGELKLGEPEFSRQSETNIYILEWTKIDMIDENIFHPKELINTINNLKGSLE